MATLVVIWPESALAAEEGANFSEWVDGKLTPLLTRWGMWFAWAVFVLGGLYRIISFLTLAKKRDKVVYNHFSWKWVGLTWLRYIFPFNQTVKANPVTAILSYVFHICLLGSALLLGAHLTAWQQGSLGINLTFLAVNDPIILWASYIIMAIAAYLLIRRIFFPAVRIVTEWSDYALLILTVAPVITGWLLLEYGDTWADSETLIKWYYYVKALHIISAIAWLVAVPLTKLAHAFMFFPSRMVMGIEWGRRGYSA